MTKFGDIPGNSGGFDPYPATVIAGSQNCTNLTYTTLTTPDVVTGVVMPVNGLIGLSYRALVAMGAGDGFGAIFLGSNELTLNTSGAPISDGSPGTNFQIHGSLNTGLVTSDTSGLRAMANTGASTSLVTTGSVMGTPYAGGGAGQGLTPGGGICWIEAAAGTYDISVQYKVTASSLIVSNRILRVWTMDFS